MFDGIRTTWSVYEFADIAIPYPTDRNAGEKVVALWYGPSRKNMKEGDEWIGDVCAVTTLHSEPRDHSLIFRQVFFHAPTLVSIIEDKEHCKDERIEAGLLIAHADIRGNPGSFGFFFEGAVVPLIRGHVMQPSTYVMDNMTINYDRVVRMTVSNTDHSLSV